MTADEARDASEAVVLDAATLVDLLSRTELAAPVAARLRGSILHAPALIDAEVLSALGRLQRAGELTDTDVETALTQLETVPMTRHLIPGLLGGAWARRGALRLTDALYVELADQLDVTVVTTDQRLARGSDAVEAISA